MPAQQGYFDTIKAIGGSIFTVDETVAISAKAPKASPTFSGTESQTDANGNKFARITKDIQSIGDTGTLTLATLTYTSTWGNAYFETIVTATGASGYNAYSVTKRFIYYQAGTEVITTVGTDAEAGIAITYVDAGSNKIDVVLTNNSGQTINGGAVVTCMGGGKDGSGDKGFILS